MLSHAPIDPAAAGLPRFCRDLRLWQQRPAVYAATGAEASARQTCAGTRAGTGACQHRRATVQFKQCDDSAAERKLT